MKKKTGAGDPIAAVHQENKAIDGRLERELELRKRKKNSLKEFHPHGAPSLLDLMALTGRSIDGFDNHWIRSTINYVPDLLWRRTQYWIINRGRQI